MATTPSFDFFRKFQGIEDSQTEQKQMHMYLCARIPLGKYGIITIGYLWCWGVDGLNMSNIWKKLDMYVCPNVFVSVDTRLVPSTSLQHEEEQTRLTNKIKLLSEQYQALEESVSDCICISSHYSGMYCTTFNTSTRGIEAKQLHVSSTEMQNNERE